MDIKIVVGLIIGIFALALLLYYMFSASGGPLDMIMNLLGFMNTTSDYVAATGNI